MPKPLHLIAACAENRVIGRDGKLPWQIPEDAKFFHDQTRGQIVVMGRICFETWPRAAQDGRRPIVVTHDARIAARRRRGQETPPYTAGDHGGVRGTSSFSAAIALADSLPGEIFICGGQRIFEEALSLAVTPNRPIRLHLTLIHAEIQGDRFFPEWRHLTWRELSRRESADANYRYTFLELER